MKADESSVEGQTREESDVGVSGAMLASVPRVGMKGRHAQQAP